MSTYPFTRKFLWLSFALTLVTMPLASGLHKDLGGLTFLVWPIFPVAISFVVIGIFSVHNSWHLRDNLLYKGRNVSDSLDLSNLEWVLFDKPKTRMDQKRYDLTKGSNRHQFWKVIDNTVCIKSKDGKYLMLNVHFYNGAEKFLSSLKDRINCKNISVPELNSLELRAFKNGDSNHIFKL